MAGMYVESLKGIALYARARVYAMVLLAVWVKLEFRLIIKFWCFKQTISWSTSHSADLRLSVDIWLEMVVSKQSALYGEATVSVRLFGYEFSPSLKVGNDSDHLQVARKELASLLTNQSLSIQS